MLKITAIGNLTHDVELKMNEATGKPYAILRIASDRRYKDKDGNKLTDFISIKVRGPLAEVFRTIADIIEQKILPADWRCADAESEENDAQPDGNPA